MGRMGSTERRSKKAACELQTKDAKAEAMKQTATRNRRTFQGEWDEIDYLYMKILHWFYDRGDRRKALPYCNRLQMLLETTPDAHEAIFGEECWSLICEVRGDLTAAIAYREREIELSKRLIRSAVNSPNRAYILQNRDYSDLSDRLDLLAILYHDAGDLGKAIQLLKDSRRLCRRHGIPFDGEDLLCDYRAETVREKGGQPISR
jgi:tetratricopeptide (TPR) repeat protein